MGKKVKSKFVEFAELLANYSRESVAVRIGDVLLTIVEPKQKWPEGAYRLVDVPVEEALQILGVDLGEAERRALEMVLSSREGRRLRDGHVAALLAALQVADNAFELQQMLSSVGVDGDVVQLLAESSPKWATGLSQLLRFPVEQIKNELSKEQFASLWERATLDEKVDVAAHLKDDIPEFAELLEEAWKEFDAKLYNASLIPALMGFDAEENGYERRKTAAYNVLSKSPMVRSPEWVVAVKEVPVVEALPGRKLGKNKMIVDTPIVRLPQRLRDVEEAIDLLDGSTVVLRTKHGVVVILCALAGEIYVVEGGRVTTASWEEYVNYGVPFIYRYVRPDDCIKYVVVNPKKNSKLVLSRTDVAALLRHFGYDSEEKLRGEFPDEVVKVLVKLQQSLPTTGELSPAIQKPMDGGNYGTHEEKEGEAN